jgi:hypothetical protein
MISNLKTKTIDIKEFIELKELNPTFLKGPTMSHQTQNGAQSIRHTHSILSHVN